MYNNYRQASSIIKTYGQELADFKQLHPSVTDADFEQWPAQELEYLRQVRTEPEQDIQVVAYVEALQGLARAE